MELMAALNIDPSAFDIRGSRDYLSNTYALVEALEPLLLQYRGTDRLKAFVRHGENDYGTLLSFTNYDVAVSYAPRASATPLAAGLVVELAPDKLLLAGMMCSFSFRPKAGVNKKVDFLRLEEGAYRDGVWTPGRVLNGDERMPLKLGAMAECRMVELYQY